MRHILNMLVVDVILTFAADSKYINDPTGDHSRDSALVGLCLQVFLVATFPLFCRQLQQ
jgi:hypothetical protein